MITLNAQSCRDALKGLRQICNGKSTMPVLGYLPGDKTAPATSGNGSTANGNGDWQCSDKQRGLLLKGALRERKRLFSRLNDKERQPFYKLYRKDKLTKFDEGLTLMELMAVIAAIGIICLWIAGAIAAGHFIIKYW